jgi:hypothetical protein
MTSAETLIVRASAKHGSLVDYVRALALNRTFAVEHEVATKAAVAPSEMPLTGRPGYQELILDVEHIAVLTRIRGAEIPFATTSAVATTMPEPTWVSRGANKPVAAAPFTNVTLDPATVATLIVTSKETLRAAGPRADAALMELLEQAAVRALNATLLSDAAAVAGESPAGLANGLAPVSAASLADADIFDAALALLAGMRRPTLVGALPAVLRIRAALGAGGELVNALVAPEAGDLVYAIDQGAVVYAFGGVNVQASDETALQMTGSPSADPTAMVSMFQTNNVALRVDAYANWEVVRDGGVRVLALAGS